jgi:UTP-glucose-1-phosphate uridylyltransferase
MNQSIVCKAVIPIAGFGTRHFPGERMYPERVLDCGGKRSATPLCVRIFNREIHEIHEREKIFAWFVYFAVNGF